MASRLRGYALFNVVLCLALIPILTGLVQRIGMKAGVDLAGYQTFLNGTHGLLQRVAALLIFGSIGVVAHRLRHPRRGSLASAHASAPSPRDLQPRHAAVR